PEWSRHVTIVHQTKDLHTADYTQLYDFLKYNQKEVDELKGERLGKIQDPLALMANSNNPYVFPAPHQDQSSFNQNYLQQPMPNPEDITDPTTVKNMALALMAKAFKLNYLTPTNNNQRISSNPRDRQIAQPGMNMGQDRQMHMVGGQDRQMQMVGGNNRNQFRQYAGQNVGNVNGYNDIQNVGNQIKADDKAIQTILLGLPEDIYVAVDSCETAQEIWLRVQQMMKGSDIGIQKKNAKMESKSYHCSSNKGLAYSRLHSTNVGNVNGYNDIQNVGNQVIQNAIQNPRILNVRNQNGLIVVPGNANQNPNGKGNLVSARAEGNATRHNGNHIRCYNCKGLGHFASNCTVRPS
nr:hypothetical protein [Tanacetum cinerariifolium]